MKSTQKKTQIYIDGSVIAVNRPSGIGHMLLNILKAFPKSEEYAITLFGTREEITKLQSFASEYIKVKTLKLPNRRILNALNYLGLMPPIDSMLGRGVYLFPNYMNYPLTKRSKSLTWIHDLAFEKFPETVSLKLQNNFHKNVGKWISRTTAVVTLSKFIKSEILETYAVVPEKVEVVYCGVDTKHFYKRPTAEVKQVQSKYSLPEKYILYIGNIEPRKNLERFINAYIDLKPELTQQYALVLVGGGGWNNSQIYKLIGNAKNRGYKIVLPNLYIEDNDMPAVISAATVLVSPTIYEGFGMTPLESLACKTPIIVSDIPVFREIYSADTPKFNPNDAKDITRKLEMFLQQNAKLKNKIVETNYSWDKTAEQVLEIISKLQK